jgi:hypothetical protein
MPVHSEVPGAAKWNLSGAGYHCIGPYSRYLEKGSPTDLGLEMVAELNDLSSGKPVDETTVTTKGDEGFSTTQPLRENDVCLFALAP